MLAQHDPHIERLLQWDAGQTPGPVRFLLVPTNRCNLTCRTCWRQSVQASGGTVDLREMSDERLLRLVDEAAELGVQQWFILGGGEPMLRGRLVIELFKRIRQLGMNGGMNTNGTLFNREYFEELIRIGWERILFSVDGPDAETNDFIRSEGAFERARRNMLLLAELKKEQGVEFPKAGLNTVITSVNFSQIDRMVDLALETRCDQLNLCTLVPFENSNDGLRLSREQKAGLPVHLEKAAEKARDAGLSTNMDEFFSAKPAEPGGAVPPPTAGMLGATCFEAWLTVMILANGQLGPCCQFWDETADSVADRPLREVWLGPYMTHVRERLTTGSGLPHYCKNCTTADRCRTRRFRAAMQAGQWDRWGELPWNERFRLLDERFRGNLRERGVAETMRRAWQWARIRARR